MKLTKDNIKWKNKMRILDLKKTVLFFTNYKKKNVFL